MRVTCAAVAISVAIRVAACAAILAGCAYAAQATELPMKGDTGTIAHNATACRRSEDIERVLMLFDQQDGMAAAMMTINGKCIILDTGTIVTIEQAKISKKPGGYCKPGVDELLCWQVEHIICVRPRGVPTCAWIWAAEFRPNKRTGE